MEENRLLCALFRCRVLLEASAHELCGEGKAARIELVYSVDDFRTCDRRPQPQAASGASPSRSTMQGQAAGAGNTVSSGPTLTFGKLQVATCHCRVANKRSNDRDINRKRQNHGWPILSLAERVKAFSQNSICRNFLAMDRDF